MPRNYDPDTAPTYNETNPNCNWKSNTFTLLNIACVVADEYLLPLFFPQEALLVSAASIGASIATNIAGSACGLLSSFFRGKKPASLDAELGRAFNNRQTSTVETDYYKVAGQTIVPLAVGAAAAFFTGGRSMAGMFKRGALVTTAMNTAYQVPEAIEYVGRACTNNPMIKN